ncbi:MAG: preprotein translocase subunit SecA [Candidatus Pacebacteria bacterium]|nr:preprotein translocase subunit SecA [Candidatus Paceibacterota bacterium]
MINWVLKKIFGNRNARVLKRLRPIVEDIKALEEQYRSLTDDQLRAKTDEFRERLKAGETTDDIMREAFATVKNACRRLMGSEIEVSGSTTTWDMIPFDVQLMGAIVLHRGDIAEMATGEGKTLVATMPMYLNALTGRNCQLVTVNDYLARRDSEWMGAVYKYLGLTVGCIQHDMSPAERREQYNCDITYGTNSEFGFDYLRDRGMATSSDNLVQRDHFYCIIDEIDSILIDEARTPLIISGPAQVSTHRYDKLKPPVNDLYRRQSLLCARLTKEAKEVLNRGDATDEDVDEAVLKLCQVRMGMPKQKQLMRLLEDPVIRKQVERKELEINSENNRAWLQEIREELFFTIDERGGEADLTEQGRRRLRPDDPDAFVIPDIAAAFSQIDTDPELSEKGKAEKRAEEQQRFDVQSETIHNISQLLRAYCLFEKDVQYVVQDNKVLIVDEFTGRLMPGRRFSEGLHQALEAKEGVQIERETQTLASVTIQNYFRMYDKLAGMTGTAETEAQEFKEIYNLDVVVVPTNRPCIRQDANDRIYKTKREKFNAVIDEISECNEQGQPVLVGTISVDVSEVLSRMLQRRRIAHNVLNAKQHQREAEIVARAGQAGAVTIATNMAGRGTDIKLGPGVVDLGGLHVIASERHDARRIDRQLRGRCARQGDPGSSRFYVSLEDNLMRLFGSDRISGIMTKLGLEEGEELSHGMLSRSIERAQRRVEQQHFAIRKRTLEYDDVMNKQREVVYGLRYDILTDDDPRGMLFDFVFTAVSEQVEAAFAAGGHGGEKANWDELLNWLTRTFPISFQRSELADSDGTIEGIARTIVDRIDTVYSIKEKAEEPDAIRWLERQIMLNAIDRLYQEHLYAMDALRQGVSLRAYGQRDPLVEYKQEAYGMFSALMDTIKQEILSNMFRSATNLAAFEQILAQAPREEHHDVLGQFAGVQQAASEAASAEGGGVGPQTGGTAVAQMPQAAVTVRRKTRKVGRNEPCPCGSGKKYKQCCGR